MSGWIVFTVIAIIGVFTLVGAYSSNQIPFNMTWLSCGVAGVVIYIIGNFITSIFGRYIDNMETMRQAIKEQRPELVISNVQGVGISIAGNGKEFIVAEYGKNKVAIWNTDNTGKVTGKPLYVHRGQAANIIDRKIME
jgi:hypothetical protein